MADIIPLNGKLQLSKDKKASRLRLRKTVAVQKLFQCAHCALRCEKCGMQVAPNRGRDESQGRDRLSPYRFCQDCAEEYHDYLAHMQGRGNAELYWQSADWLEIWQRWIAYQATVNRYLKSKPFLQLLQEIKQTNPES